MQSATPLVVESRSESTSNPILKSVLNSNNDLLPYVLQYNIRSDSCSNYTQTHISELENYTCYRSSQQLSDYFIVEPEYSQKLEEAGCDNSLFLAIARSLLYRVFFINRHYESIMRNVYFKDIEFIKNFEFNSDIALQEILRKQLCLFWLKSYKNEQSLEKTKYKCDFASSCDFIYQVYQIGVNNFSKNNLFSIHALSDLATILKQKIYVFDKNTHKLKIYQESDSGFIKQDNNDAIYLLYSNNERIKYKWLMPQQLKTSINDHLLNPRSYTITFLNLNQIYKNRMLVLEIDELYKCFAYSVYKDLNIFLFISFLSECPVHTLVTVNDLNFNSIKSPVEMVDYLNAIWGQKHFSLRDAKIRMEYLIYKKKIPKRIISERSTIKDIEIKEFIQTSESANNFEAKNIRSQISSELANTPSFRPKKMGILNNHNLPPISPNLRRKSVSGAMPLIKSQSPITKFKYSPSPRSDQHSNRNILTTLRGKKQVLTNSESYNLMNQLSSMDNGSSRCIRKKNVITELSARHRTVSAIQISGTNKCHQII